MGIEGSAVILPVLLAPWTATLQPEVVPGDKASPLRDPGPWRFAPVPEVHYNQEQGKPMTRDELLGRIKSSLTAAFGERFQGLVLYGSEARGEACPDSDIDLLVLLRGPLKLGRDLEKILDATYDLQLEITDEPGPLAARIIHASPVDAEVFQQGHFALYRNAKSEGIFL